MKKQKLNNYYKKHGEAVNLSYRNTVPSFFEIADITIALKKLESHHPLSAKSLLNLAQIFQLSQELKDYFNKDFLDKSEYAILANVFSQLYANKGVTDRILQCILDEETTEPRKHYNPYEKSKKN